MGGFLLPAISPGFAPFAGIAFCLIFDSDLTLGDLCYWILFSFSASFVFRQREERRIVSLALNSNRGIWGGLYLYLWFLRFVIALSCGPASPATGMCAFPGAHSSQCHYASRIPPATATCFCCFRLTPFDTSSRAAESGMVSDVVCGCHVIMSLY